MMNYERSGFYQPLFSLWDWGLAGVGSAEHANIANRTVAFADQGGAGIDTGGSFCQVVIIFGYEVGNC